jgi:AbrB family looped-hinge helix DNA binding protein
MNQSATITSKMQLTIPMVIAKSIGIKRGEKVSVATKYGQIIIMPLKKLVEDIGGSVKVPHELRGQDLNSAIRQAKQNYFQSKYSNKNS